MTDHLEKHLNNLEQQITTAKGKLAPLAERTAKLNQHADAVRQHLASLTTILGAFETEISDVEKEIAGLGQLFDGVAQGLVTAKSEAGGNAEIAAAHAAVASMFTEAFPAVTRFFDTAKKLGLVAQDSSMPTVPKSMIAEPVASPTGDAVAKVSEVPEIPEPIEAPAPEASVLGHNDEPQAVQPPVPEIPSLADIDAVLGNDHTEETPVHLPPLPDVSAADAADDTDSEAVEAMLADLSKPIST